MLKEIFHTIASETENYFLLKGITIKTSIGDLCGTEPSGNRLVLAMQDYGIDPYLKNHSHLLDEGPEGMPNYAHLISFYFIPYTSDYLEGLHWIETLVELFEVKPFFQLETNGNTYELAISIRSSGVAEFQQFWIAKQQPARPVLFYQARVSSL